MPVLLNNDGIALSEAWRIHFLWLLFPIVTTIVVTTANLFFPSSRGQKSKVKVCLFFPDCRIFSIRPCMWLLLSLQFYSAWFQPHIEASILQSQLQTLGKRSSDWFSIESGVFPFAKDGLRELGSSKYRRHLERVLHIEE